MMKCSCFQAKRSLLSTLYCQTSETKKKSSLPKKKNYMLDPDPSVRAWIQRVVKFEVLTGKCKSKHSKLLDLFRFCIHCKLWYIRYLAPNHLVCRDTSSSSRATFLSWFRLRYISNPIKTSLAINLVVFFTLPGVVLVIGRYGTFGIDIYRLAIV